MCRLYGMHATEPTKVECSLVLAQNALLSQSRADLRGTSHPDGWGVAWYDDSVPSVVRRELAAFADVHFSVAVERMFTRTVLAHVRQATVGGATLANTHPFVYGVWSFAHNGTVRGLHSVGPRLAKETDSGLGQLRRGETDSEAVFYWLLTRMSEAGIALDAPAPDPEPVARLLTEAVLTLDERSREAEPEKPARLNFLLTDGRSFLGTRWRNSLYWLERDGIRDCEVCGIPHVHHIRGTEYRAVLVASEPITHEAWCEVPDGELVVVTDGVQVETRPIGITGDGSGPVAPRTETRPLDAPGPSSPAPKI